MANQEFNNFGVAGDLLFNLTKTPKQTPITSYPTPIRTDARSSSALNSERGGKKSCWGNNPEKKISSF